MRTIGRGKQQWVGLAIIAALYGVSVAWVPTVAAQGAQGYMIMQANYNKCLQPADGSLDEGAPIIQTTCNGASAIQRWEFLYQSNTIFQVRNVVSGRCLDVAGGATNHTRIQQWTCNGISNQKWDRGPNWAYPHWFFYLRSRVSGTSSHCLDAEVVTPGSSDGVWLQLYRCQPPHGDNQAQTWGIWPLY